MTQGMPVQVVVEMSERDFERLTTASMEWKGFADPRIGPNGVSIGWRGHAADGRFESLDGLVERVRAGGRRAGIWVAPFLVGEKSRVFACPCHESAFAIADGARLKGPSARGLDPLPIEAKDGKILLTWKRFIPGLRSRREA